MQLLPVPIDTLADKLTVGYSYPNCYFPFAGQFAGWLISLMHEILDVSSDCVYYHSSFSAAMNPWFPGTCWYTSRCEPGGAVQQPPGCWHRPDPARLLQFMGIVGMFRGNDRLFGDFQSDWIPILYLNTIQLTLSFCRKNRYISITFSSRCGLFFSPKCII